MLLLVLLMLVPVASSLERFVRTGRTLSRAQLAIQIAVGVALMICGYYLLRWVGVQDNEVWNGRIVGKDAGTSTCCHDYECNCSDSCSVGGNGQQTCTQICQRCSLHVVDEFWRATSSNDEVVYFSGCWSPGSRAPAEWDAIRIGEPTAWEHRFTNYVLAVPDELIPQVDSERFAEMVPAYPRPEQWRARRLLFVGIDDVPGLDDALDEMNADIGAHRQANVIVVVVRESDPAYFAALRRAWLGGKKNDVVLVIGAPYFPQISWARVMAWNVVEDPFTLELGRRIEAMPVFEGTTVLAAVREEVERGFHRRPFAELAHLMEHARPSWWAVLLLVGVGAGAPVGLGRWFERGRRPVSRK